MNSIGQRIKESRGTMTQEKLSEIVGVSSESIRLYEKDSTKPSGEVTDKTDKIPSGLLSVNGFNELRASILSGAPSDKTDNIPPSGTMAVGFVKRKMHEAKKNPPSPAGCPLEE